MTQGISPMPIADQSGALQPLQYRAEIQGLRAIAILLVVFCHAGVPGFASGFIGVDLFFVLSGYLISGLLLTELQTQGRIDLLAFYARRFRRLLPALLCVVLATMALAAVVTAPFEQQPLARTTGFVAFWLSNFHFALGDFDYFAPEASANALLHTWSLAVEEQFYLFWPLLLMALVGEGSISAAIRMRRLRTGLLLVLLAGLLLCLYWSWRAPLLAFYLMPSRMWQFATGALVFVVANGVGGRLKDALAPVLPLAALTGLLLLALSLAVIGADSVYPGGYALLPTLAAALLLLGSAQSPSVSAVTRLLGTAPLRWLGDLSYAWYLWHWPLLVLGRLLLPPDSLAGNLAVLLLALLLAQLTHVLVEQPMRRWQPLASRPRLTVALAAAGMVAVLVVARGWLQLADEWSQSPQQMAYRQLREDGPPLYRQGCDSWYSSARVVACGAGSTDATHTAVLIGDSVGAQWFTPLSQIFSRPGWRLIVFTKSSCPIVDEPVFYERIGQWYDVCENWRDDLLGRLAQQQVDVVLFGSDRDYRYSEQQWQDGTRRILDRLTPVSRHVFVIAGTPSVPFDAPGCLARQQWQPRWLASTTACSFTIDAAVSGRVDNSIRSAVATHANVHWLDLNPLICPGGECRAVASGLPVFRDDEHLSNTFAASLRDALLEQLRILAADLDL